MASVVGVGELYYKLLLRYRDDPAMAPALAQDEAESAFEHFRSAFHGSEPHGKERRIAWAALAKEAAEFQAVVSGFINRREGGAAAFSRWIMLLPGEVCGFARQLIFAEAVLDERINAADRVRLLSVQWSARSLRQWTDAVKK